MQIPTIPMTSRGRIMIKGKGKMHTFWVNEGESFGRGNSAYDMLEAMGEFTANHQSTSFGELDIEEG